MPACLPPPPPLTAIVREATNLVSERVAPIAAPTICLDDVVVRGSGQATPGRVAFSPLDEAAMAVAPNTWTAPRVTLVLHEVLHQVGLTRGMENGGDMVLEEGVVEAVAQDLRPALMRRLGAPQGQAALAYRSTVATVRRASARATGKRWTAPAAAAWRMNLLATPPPQRVLPA